jgi:hypothetical protein
MDDLDANRKSQLNKRSNKNFPVLRWLGGGAIGCFSGLLLLGITLVLGPTLPGTLFVGQYFIFLQFFAFIFSSLYRQALSDGAHFLAAGLAYTITWGIIGALLGSGRKKQEIIGIVIAIIYVALGILGLQLYGSIIFPT